MLENIILIIHFIVSVVLIVIVLLQADKGDGLSGAFGGGAAQTVFGSGGDLGFFGKLTTVMAVVFMLTSFSLYFLSVSPSRSGQVPGRENVPANEINVPMTTAPVGEVSFDD